MIHVSKTYFQAKVVKPACTGSNLTLYLSKFGLLPKKCDERESSHQRMLALNDQLSEPILLIFSPDNLQPVRLIKRIVLRSHIIVETP